jgi:hypothetical protein
LQQRNPFHRARSHGAGARVDNTLVDRRLTPSPTSTLDWLHARPNRISQPRISRPVRGGNQGQSHPPVRGLFRFPQNGCLSCSHLGLCLSKQDMIDARLIRRRGGDLGWLDQLAFATPHCAARPVLRAPSCVPSCATWHSPRRPRDGPVSWECGPAHREGLPPVTQVDKCHATDYTYKSDDTELCP